MKKEKDDVNQINFDNFEWNTINKDNILNKLDEILFKLFPEEKKEEEYSFMYDKDEGYIIYNLVFLKFDSNENRKNNNIILANKIDNFIKNNIDEFKNTNTNIFLRSPFFENQIEEERLRELENEMDLYNEYEDSLEICNICNTNNVKHLGDKQVRSSDEGMTSFFICINNNCPYYIENNRRYQFKK
jgi:DNA-directed RNA polymerase subunit M/transcription elongation factor TFIIS